LQPLDFAFFGLHFFRQRGNLPMAGLQLLSEFFDLTVSSRVVAIAKPAAHSQDRYEQHPQERF
jgi:hypothetical protein